MDSIMIGIKLRECRNARNLTQQELAEKAGITPHYLGDIERGSKVPKLETFIRLLNGLDVSVDYVLMDVLQSTYKLKASKLEESIESLPPNERAEILNILENMITNVKK